MPSDPLIGRGLLGADEFVTTSGGRRLRTMVAGGGDDLVVLEAGLGVSSLYWGPVHAALSRSVRVVAYDRAGFGGSTPASDCRDLAHLATDLSAIVDAYPHRRLIVVGHSWGGPIVRTFAALAAAGGAAPTGLVLVDPSDEHAADLYTSRFARWSNASQNALLVPLARARLLGPLMKMQLTGLPPEFLQPATAASSTVGAARATAREGANLAHDMRDLSAHPPSLGRMALIVISGQKHGRVDAKIRARVVEAHRQTVRDHSGAEFVPAMKSGHLIPVTQPELVVEQVLALL